MMILTNYDNIIIRNQKIFLVYLQYHQIVKSLNHTYIRITPLDRLIPILYF